MNPPEAAHAFAVLLKHIHSIPRSGCFWRMAGGTRNWTQGTDPRVSTDSQSTPVVETQPNEQQPDLTMRALEERIRQQEILAELGVAALQGASLEQLLSRHRAPHGPRLAG